MTSQSAALRRVLEVLDQLEIRYFIGGSVASAAHGIPRTTRDVDFVVAFDADLVDEFCRLLGAEFYHDADTIRRALRLGRSFNIIHIPSSYKFDFFPGTDEFSRTQMGRRLERKADPFADGAIETWVATPEDVILSKLRWFQLGNGANSQQWHDVWGVAHLHRGRLDLDYLTLWASRLGISDLLDELLKASSSAPTN